MDPKLITPLLTAAFVLWAIYRRTRRSFGRQRVVARRMWFRIGVLAVVGGLVLVASAHELRSAAALLAGAAAGYVGLQYTRFEATPEGRFYTPHTYIGLIVTALFLGRLLYRFLVLYSGTHGLAAPGPGLGGPPAYAGAYPSPYAYQNPYAYQRSPLTLAIFGALVGYYVLYYLGVLGKSKRPASSEAGVLDEAGPRRL